MNLTLLFYYSHKQAGTELCQAQLKLASSLYELTQWFDKSGGQAGAELGQAQSKLGLNWN